MEQLWRGVLQRLRGHAATVNAALVCPVNANMIVSASDDHTLRVWSHVPGM